jgi:hypothetical protein
MPRRRLLQPVKLKMSSHPRVNLLKLEGLGNVVSRSTPEGIHLVLSAVQHAQKNHGNRPEVLAGFEVRTNFITSDLRIPYLLLALGARQLPLLLNGLEVQRCT